MGVIYYLENHMTERMKGVYNSTGDNNQDIINNCSVSPRYCNFKPETLSAKLLTDGSRMY